MRRLPPQKSAAKSPSVRRLPPQKSAAKSPSVRLASIFSACALLATASELDAAAGASGADFLRMNTSPRVMGMGEAGVAVGSDVLGAVALNPAGLARLTYAEAGFSYNQWVESLALHQISIAVPTRRFGAFALSGTLLRSEPIATFDAAGDRQPDIFARDLAISPSYAVRVLGPEVEKRLGLFVGGSLKYARSDLDVLNGHSFLADVGLLWASHLGPGEFSAGFSAASLGQGPRFDTVRVPPPTVYRAGLGYSLPILGDPLTFAWDSKKPRDEDLTHSLGFEYAVKRILFWRMGYATGQTLGNGLRLGVGFKLKVFTLDYALAPLGDFGFSHLMGVSMRFGEPIDRTPIHTASEKRALDHVGRGKAKLREGRAYEAAVEFSEALRLDPYNKEALKLLRQARDAVKRSK